MLRFCHRVAYIYRYFNVYQHCSMFIVHVSCSEKYHYEATWTNSRITWLWQTIYTYGQGCGSENLISYSDPQKRSISNSGFGFRQNFKSLIWKKLLFEQKLKLSSLNLNKFVPTYLLDCGRLHNYSEETLPPSAYILITNYYYYILVFLFITSFIRFEVKVYHDTDLNIITFVPLNPNPY